LALFTSKTWRVSTLAAFFIIACLLPSAADAKRKKRSKKPVAAKIDAAALSQLMGPFSFGMSKDKVLKVLARQLNERYEDKVKETQDVYKQDALRREKKAELKKIKKTYTEFTGKKTGWDVSIIDDQFAHKTDESMLVYWENSPDGKDQRRFFFFHHGELYKMFITLDSSMLPPDQRTFDFFKGLMVKRYGPGNVITETKRNGEQVAVAMDWADKKHHVQAIDKVSFYGSFCLSIANVAVEASVAAARDAMKKPTKDNAIINSMLEGDDSTLPSLDSNKAAVESIIHK